MFWCIYLLSITIFSFLLGTLATKKTKRIIVFSSLVILLTPAQIEVGLNNYAPALFTFLFNSLLEQDYSLRVLRPVFLTLPISFLFLTLFFLFRKKFF